MFLQVSRETIRSRTIEARRGTGFYKYIAKFGNTEGELVDYFVSEQERMLELLASSSVTPCAVIDADQLPELVHRTVLAIVSKKRRLLPMQRERA